MLPWTFAECLLLLKILRISTTHEHRRWIRDVESEVELVELGPLSTPCHLGLILGELLSVGTSFEVRH